MDKLNKARKALQAARAADALLNEIPQQQEEEGDAEAPQPPTLPTPEPEGEEPPEDEEDKTPQEILNPGGNPIGEQGNSKRVRIIRGGDKSAQKLYKQLGKGGKPDTPPDYPGKGTRLPNDDWVGYRPNSKSELPTVDVKIEGVDFRKIHFPE